MTRFAWDSADQLAQVTSPDPDGAGALLSRAVKSPDGQASKQELGTANSDGSGFAAAQTVDVNYGDKLRSNYGDNYGDSALNSRLR